VERVRGGAAPWPGVNMDAKKSLKDRHRGWIGQRYSGAQAGVKKGCEKSLKIKFRETERPCRGIKDEKNSLGLVHGWSKTQRPNTRAKCGEAGLSL